MSSLVSFFMGFWEGMVVVLIVYVLLKKGG